MTRVLFACWPFEGHIFPQMSMAFALREGGAEVAVYADESRREMVESEGFRAADLTEHLAGPGRVRSRARTKNPEESWS